MDWIKDNKKLLLIIALVVVAVFIAITWSSDDAEAVETVETLAIESIPSQGDQYVTVEVGAFYNETDVIIFTAGAGFGVFGVAAGVAIVFDDTDEKDVKTIAVGATIPLGKAVSLKIGYTPKIELVDDKYNVEFTKFGTIGAKVRFGLGGN